MKGQPLIKRAGKLVFALLVPGGLLVLALEPVRDWLVSERTSSPEVEPSPQLEGYLAEEAPIDPWLAPDLPETLSRALGLTWEDLLILELLCPLENPDLEHDHGGLLHYGWQKAGIELLFDRSTRLLSVTLQTGLRDGYETFQGTWPGELRPESSPAHIAGLFAGLGRVRVFNGDCDCFESRDDMWCITYAADSGGNQAVLNAVLRRRGDPLNLVEGVKHPLPPSLPTREPTVTITAP